MSEYGNHVRSSFTNKRVHPMVKVWEDFYGVPVPKGCLIHHLNGDKKDNRIENLECMTHSEHQKYHTNNRTLSEETRKKMSAAHKGRAPSEEHRRALSEAAKRDWAKRREMKANNLT